MAFEFDGDGLPGFSVQYVTQDQVVGCASGAPELVLGDAYLQVRFTPANAHDEQGNQSFDPGDQLPPGFTSLFDAILTCDFEAEVTWVFGLAAEVDFRVLPLRDPPRLAVDVAH